MKLIVAFIHPSQADRVVQVLERAGLFQMSVARVHSVVHPGGPIVRADLAPEGSSEVRFEAYCEEPRVEHVVTLRKEAARIGDFPAGAVFVHPVEQAWGLGPSTT